MVSVLFLAVFSLPASAMPPKQMKQILNMTQNNGIALNSDSFKVWDIPKSYGLVTGVIIFTIKYKALSHEDK